MTPTYRHSFSGILENACYWVKTNPAATITMVASTVAIVIMYVMVARWDKQKK
jgi:hypothetical protein